MRSQYTQSARDVNFYAHPNTGPGTNTFVFGILVILMQIAICIIYGILIWVPTFDYRNPLGPVAFTDILITVLFFFLVILGFSTLIAYHRKLVWSTLGFNLLIACLTIQWYFLINLFWLKTNIRGLLKFNQGVTYNRIWLTNAIYYTDKDGDLQPAIGQSLCEALKCALANIIAFSGIIGRSGPLQAFMVCIVGTIGYCLCKHIIQYLHFDFGSTYIVFVFGGFMSLMLGLFVRCRTKEQPVTTTGKFLYQGNLFSGAMSFFGCSMIYAVFPIILADIEFPWIIGGAPQQVSQILNTATHVFVTAPLAMWYSMSAAVIMGLAGSIIVYGKSVPRDMINGLVAGGIAAATSSFYFTNPVWPMVLGSTVGFIQAIIQGLIEKRIAMKSRIFNTYSFSLWGVQGIIGAVFASIFRKVVEFRKDNLNYNFATHVRNGVQRVAGWDLAMALLAAGFGLAFGLLGGIFALICNRHQGNDDFDDYTYWVPDDGIRYPRQIVEPVIIPQPIPPPPVPVPVIDSQIYVKETVVNVKAKHAYL